jgi:hypothetical protein
LNALIGVPELYIPDQDDVNKQLFEIGVLVKGAPTQMPPQMGPDGQPAMGPDGQPQQPQMQPSVPIDPTIDDDEIHIGVCKIYLKSPEGLASQGTPGYQNVQAHLEAHLQNQQMQQMQQMQQQAMMGGQGQPGQSGDTSGNQPPANSQPAQ